MQDCNERGREAGVICNCKFCVCCFSTATPWSIATLYIQTGNAMKLIFVWSVEKHLMREEWRYVWVEGGAQCAMTGGTSEMLKLCVDNSGIMDVSLYLPLFTVSCYCLLFPTASYSQLSASSRGDPLYFLDDVHCMGKESKLSDCSHNGVGVYDCYSGEAGVICTSKFMFIYVNTEKIRLHLSRYDM